MGASDATDAKPVIDLFDFIKSILGPENKLHIIIATRLAVVNQILKSKDELKELYKKLKLPEHLASTDHKHNQAVLNNCYQLGQKLTK